MENLDFLRLGDHDYCGSGTLSARRAERPRRSQTPRQCSCCRHDQQAPAPAARKRKRTSAPRPGLQATPSPEELLEVSSVVPGPCTRPLQQDQDLQIHEDLQVLEDLQIHEDFQITGRSAFEYQQLYHAVVDDLLRFKNGSCRPYSLRLGRLLKQRLWEQLAGPTFTETVDDDGLVNVHLSYGGGAYPPRYDVDTSGEPEPETRPKHPDCYIFLSTFSRLQDQELFEKLTSHDLRRNTEQPQDDEKDGRYPQK